VPENESSELIHRAKKKTTKLGKYDKPSLPGGSTSKMKRLCTNAKVGALKPKCERWKQVLIERFNAQPVAGKIPG
jgi:hypothetical protein